MPITRAARPLPPSVRAALPPPPTLVGGLLPERLVPPRERLLHVLDDVQAPAVHLLLETVSLVPGKLEPSLELADDFPDDVRRGAHLELRLERVRVGQEGGGQADGERLQGLGLGRDGAGG